MSEDSALRLSVERGLELLGISSTLKPQQMQALESFTRGRDTFVNLPTGFGKSVIFQLAPLCVDYVKVRYFSLHFNWDSLRS